MNNSDSSGHTHIKANVLFWWILGAFLITSTGMRVFNAPLVTAEAPLGIISFELAGSLEASDRILHSWNDNAKLHAAISLGFDFLFIPVYVTLLLVSISLTTGKPTESVPIIRNVAWGIESSVVIAGLLDVVENISLIAILLGNRYFPLPEIAEIAAASKFSVLAVSFVAIVVGILYRLSIRIFSKS